MTRNMLLAFAILLFAGIATPAFAQTADHIVINEIELNPSDAVEWVELYNPTNSDVHLHGWTISSTNTIKRTIAISSGVTIEPNEFLLYSYKNAWLSDANESVELRNNKNSIVDKTPILSDAKKDNTTWQRLYDGYDTDSYSDWKFENSTASATNDSVAMVSEKTTITVSTDKDTYLSGDTLVISGSVSERITITKPSFKPTQITVSIKGPDYDNSITLYPGFNLNYQASISLFRPYGVMLGEYDVTVKYADATAKTSFSIVVDTPIKQEKKDQEFGIETDKSQYLPGQTVYLTGFTNKTTPLKGMTFAVTDSDDRQIASGNLFPIDGKFTTTTIFLNTVNPVYGTYTISAKYSESSASASFEILEDLKEDTVISLWTDKDVYGVGDTVNISGRINQVWTSTLDLEVLQTKQTTIRDSVIGGDIRLKINDGLTISGDGSFDYSFVIPDTPTRLGDYKITVSKNIGSATIIVPVVSDPANYVASDVPITLSTDKDSYEFGQIIMIDGFIKDLYEDNNDDVSPVVDILLSYQGESSTPADGKLVAKHQFTEVPETSGHFKVNIPIAKLIFDPGNYIAWAKYQSVTATTSFSISDLLDADSDSAISLDKKVYGLGETVHLTGIIPPSSDNTVSITLTRPDGTISNFGTVADGQRFSWNLVLPSEEKQQTTKYDDGRDVRYSNYGIYKLSVSTFSQNMNFFFKVSADPENDTLSSDPVFFTTDKSLYKKGDKLRISGNVLLREQGTVDQNFPERVYLKVTDGSFPFRSLQDSAIYPSQNGEFTSIFDLPITIYDDGPYRIRATYDNTNVDAHFNVASVPDKDADLDLTLTTEKSKYYLGETVDISGEISSLVYVDKYKVNILKQYDDCSPPDCNTDIDSVILLPSLTGSFSHQYVIPENSTAVGSYRIVADAGFQASSASFDVIEKPLPSKISILFDKAGRIVKDNISITTQEKTTSDGTFAPRGLSGSLITPMRDDESRVNLRVSTSDGTCVIGPEDDCMVQDSTRALGQIYSTVTIDDVKYNVRYSGPDVRLEKFSIIPESSDTFLPEDEWSVDILKDDQVSRFYYKVTYKATE